MSWNSQRNSTTTSRRRAKSWVVWLLGAIMGLRPSRRRRRGRLRLVLVARVGIVHGRVVVAEIELAAQAAGEGVDLAAGSSGREDRLKALLEDLAEIGAARHRGGVELLQACLLEACDGLLECAVTEDVELPEALDALPEAADAAVAKRPAGLHVLKDTVERARDLGVELSDAPVERLGQSLLHLVAVGFIGLASLLLVGGHARGAHLAEAGEAQLVAQPEEVELPAQRLLARA